MNLYSKQFCENIHPQHHLMASFISAMMDFSEEAFLDASRVDLIKLGDQKLILHNFNEFVLCYIYKGTTQRAVKQLTLFTDQFTNLEQTYAHLGIGMLEPSDLKKLDHLVDQVFG
jgi:hypothetical protein